MSGKNKKEFFILHINLTHKLSLCFYSTLYKSSEINENDPTHKLLSEYFDIEIIHKLNDSHITKFLYFNRNYVNTILYNSEKIIHFLYEEKNTKLSFYFYLNLLIKDEPDILNYTYSSDYIKEANKKQEENENIYNKIIMSKIIIELSEDFKETYDFMDNKNENEYDRIIEINLDIIQKNIDIFKSLNINWTKEDILSMKIEQIYTEIIIELIKIKKIEDYNFVKNIIDQLDLENIDLTKFMYIEISKILNEKENYINDYIITNEEDLKNKNKINFYFILIKYILKNEIYIYQIPFLVKTGVIIKKMIISKKIFSIESFDNSDFENKIMYIIDVFSESNNYLKNNPKKKNHNLIDYFIKFKMKASENDIDNKNNKNNTLNNSNKTIISRTESRNLTDRSENTIQSTHSTQNGHKLNNTILIKNDGTELSCFKYLKEIFSDPKYINIMRKSKDKYIYFDYKEFIKKFNPKKNEEEKFIEIIKNHKFLAYASDENPNFKAAINSLFIFRTKKNNQIDLEKNLLEKKINPKSIEAFKEWLKKDNESEKSQNKS